MNQMSHEDWLKKMQDRMDWENEQAEKGIEPYSSSKARLDETIARISKHFKYNMIIPPKVFDFLNKIKVQLTKEEMKKVLLEGGEIYSVYTRKTKGTKASNPHLYLDKEMFDAIKVITRNVKSSFVIEREGITFDPVTGELNIWGFPTYIKKNTSRFRLCNFMFGGKKYPRVWQFKDLAKAIGEHVVDDSEIEEIKDKVRGKIRYLNEDIEKSIGFKDFIIEEAGVFIINPFNIPRLS